MTATLVGTGSNTTRTTLRPDTGPRRTRGVAPLARPELGGPSSSRAPRPLTGRHVLAAAACQVASPEVRRAGMLLRVKVAAVGMVALVGLGVSVAEFSSWSHPDPAVDYVAGDPAWAHVTGQ